MCLAIGMKDCLAKSCKPFSLICASRLCHKSREVSSSTAFSFPLHTFTCVLYKEKHNLLHDTTNDPLVSFQLPLLIKWLYPPLSTICTEIKFRCNLECVARLSMLVCTPYFFACRCHQSPRFGKHFCFPSSLCHSLLLYMLKNIPF